MKFNNLTSLKEKYLYAREQNLLLRLRRQRILEQAVPQQGRDTEHYPETGEWMSILDVLNPSQSSLASLKRHNAPLSDINLRCILCFECMCAGDSDDEALRRLPSLFAQAKASIKAANVKIVSKQLSEQEQKHTDLTYMVRRQTNDVLEARLLLANLATSSPEQQLRLLLSFTERLAEGNSAFEHVYRLLFSCEPYQISYKDGNTRTVQPPSYYTLDEETKGLLEALCN